VLRHGVVTEGHMACEKMGDSNPYPQRLSCGTCGGIESREQPAQTGLSGKWSLEQRACVLYTDMQKST